jgi:hypothetical protein
VVLDRHRVFPAAHQEDNQRLAACLVCLEDLAGVDPAAVAVPAAQAAVDQAEVVVAPAAAFPQLERPKIGQPPAVWRNNWT